MKFILSPLFFLVFQTITFAQTVQIKGYAPFHIGKNVQIKIIEDYLSMKEKLIASALVHEDSTFHVSFELKETKKINVYVGNDKSFMYVQANGDYYIYLPKENEYAPYRPAGNQLELTFYNLDSTDINYQILGFNRWMNNYIALNYQDHIKNPILFTQNMDSFKVAAEKYYQKDTGEFIFDYVRFTIANVIDNIQLSINRNRYEKHDFYLKYQPVCYQNDAYMSYFKNFYSGLMNTMPMKVSNRFYLGLLKSSPTLMINALGREYTLINMRVRELAMIKLLSDIYYLPDYPQKNIIQALDSIQNHALFDAHKIIAKNTKERLTEAANGGKAPDFNVTTIHGDIKSLTDYQGKYLYIHFFNANSRNSKIDFKLLENLHEKYGQNIQFLSVSEDRELVLENKAFQKIPWDVTYTKEKSNLLMNYKVETFPSYVLIDPYSYIVQAPALHPQPNNNYETIEKIFKSIEQALNYHRIKK